MKKNTLPPVLLGKSSFIENRTNIQKYPDEYKDFYTYINEAGAFMSAPYNQLILKKFLKKIKNHFLTPNILDAGSGLGFNLPTIFNSWPKAKVTALDLCKEALEISNLCCNHKQIILNFDMLKNKYRLEDRVVSELWNCRQMGFPRNKVDITVNDIINYAHNNKRLFEIVICTEVLEHVEDIERTLTSLCSLVDKKGYLILSFPNYYRNTAASIKKHNDKKKRNPGWSPWDVHEEGRENPINWMTIEKIISKLNFTIINRKAANYILAWIPHLSKRLKRKGTNNLGDSFPMIWLGDVFPYLRKFAMNYFILVASKQ
jgi:2-polyprenyl-3-methyl-5-hydroxy-6-metoxy-1,4-benzoquinol methylase